MAAETPELWVVVYEAQNEMEALVIKSKLEAEEIPVRMTMESAARLFGFTTGPLAKAEVWVPEAFEEQAKALLSD